MSERVVEPGSWTMQGSGVGAGARSYVTGPAGVTTVTVTRDLSGVATAISHLSAAHKTTGPERSHPSRRGHPPLVEFGDETTVPPSVQDATPETGIELRLPSNLETLLVGAPLAYYLGAQVTVEDCKSPTLFAPSADVAHDLDPLPAFQETAADLLRRCFFLDTLVRDDGEELAGREYVRDVLTLDVPELRAATPAKRLKAYLALPPDLDDALPEWHLSTYVEPMLSKARSLPHLVDSLSLVYLPEASELDCSERLERSLDDFYRATAETPSIEVLSPRLQDGDLHAWLADGTPIDAYKTSHAAYRNRLRYRRHEYETRDVAVVLNDKSMAAERTVADIYRETAEDVPVEVTLHESLRRDELARVFEQPHDFVHYIGHCDAEGLRCPDGNLATANLRDVRARTFFLNACGSYHEGRTLIENGSAAGAVTLTSVLDEQAATVGTTFARLLVEGYSVAGALQLARRRIMMGKDYAVVGDGTCAVVPGAEPPALLRISDAGSDEFRVRYEVPATRAPGDSYCCPLDGDSYLQGVPAEATLDRPSLISVLRERSLPTVHDGEFAWSTDLAADLDRAD